MRRGEREREEREREREEVRKFECVFVKENKRLNENERKCVPKGGDGGVNGERTYVCVSGCVCVCLGVFGCVSTQDREKETETARVCVWAKWKVVFNFV